MNLHFGSGFALHRSSASLEARKDHHLTLTSIESLTAETEDNLDEFYTFYTVLWGVARGSLLVLGGHNNLTQSHGSLPA